MEFTIQKLIFPTERKHFECRDLFFRCGNSFDLPICSFDGFLLNTKQTADFTTYFNSCSYGKWRDYTNGNALRLYLDITGKCTINYIGYSFDSGKKDRIAYGAVEKKTIDREVIQFEYSDNSSCILINGFEISAKDQCTLHGGYYSLECEKNQLNDVELCIVTTTYKKEDYISRNVNLLKRELLEAGGELSDHIFLHVVDNGKTLTGKEISGKNIFLHYNINAGGAGGFTRGMIESLQQKPAATHVLLMDDDVLVLSESIRRIYSLLKLLKKEYKEYFISGAMLNFEEPDIMYADIEDASKYGIPVKPQSALDDIESVLKNEIFHPNTGEYYAPWWYCVIPVLEIKKNAYPLPVFIYSDDMEFSLRCKPEFLTLNGICVWHMSFNRKYSTAFNEYFNFRNLLIAKAVSGILKDNQIDKLIFRRFRQHMLSYNYNAAEQLIGAFTDYCRGPSFLIWNDPEEILKERTKLNYVLIPLSEINKAVNWTESTLNSDVPRNRTKKIWYKITWNGHVFWPEKLLNSEPVAIPFHGAYQPGKITMRKYHVLVNPYERTGKVLKINKKRFRELVIRYLKLRMIYIFRKSMVEKEYRNAHKTLTSEEFWRKYLKIE